MNIREIWGVLSIQIPGSYPRPHELAFSLGDYLTHKDWQQGSWGKASRPKTKVVQGFHRAIQFNSSGNPAL